MKQFFNLIWNALLTGLGIRPKKVKAEETSDEEKAPSIGEVLDDILENEETEKKLSIFNAETSEYYEIKDFIQFLENSPEEFIDYVYVSCKVQIDFLNRVQEFEKLGFVERGYKDEEGNMVPISKEKSIKMTNKMIISLQNTIDEYVDLFDSDRISRLNEQAKEIIKGSENDDDFFGNINTPPEL